MFLLLLGFIFCVYILVYCCAMTNSRGRDAVAALGAAHVGQTRDGREVGYNRADRVELVPADQRRPGRQVDVVQNYLNNAHEDLLVHLAVVAPHGHLQHFVLVVGLEAERLLVLGIQGAPLRCGLLLLGARVPLEQVELDVHIFFFF